MRAHCRVMTRARALDACRAVRGARVASPGPRTFCPRGFSRFSRRWEDGRDARDGGRDDRTFATSSSESESRERLHAPGRHRFYVDGPLGAGTAVALSREETKHAVKALRLRVGDALEVCDGVGGLGYGTLVDVSGAVATVACLHSEEKARRWLEYTSLPWLLVSSTGKQSGPIGDRMTALA